MIKISALDQNTGTISCDLATLEIIRVHFSIANPAYGRSKGRFVSARLYAITPSGQFGLGLYDNIVAYLEANQMKYEAHPSISVYTNCGYSNPSIHQFADKTYRDHQIKSITKATEKGRGVIVIPTAGGKTLIMAGIIESLNKNSSKKLKSLVVVPSIQLVEQTAADFVEYGIKNVTKWSGNNTPDPDADIIVAGTQILLSEKSDLSELSEIGVLLIDECIRKNTLISTNKGNKKIQNIKKGDFVKSFNTKTKKIEYKPVLNTWKNLNKSNSYEEFLEIELNNGSIVHLTPNHKVYTDNGYKRADELSKEDNILFINSSRYMNLRYKYLYAKTFTQSHLFNMWKRIKIRLKTFENISSRYINQTILRQIFKKRIGGLL